MQGFKEFVQEQGVVGLAVGFMLGGAVSNLVGSFATGIIDPLIAAIFDTGNLAQQTSTVGSATLQWGAVVTLFIQFVVIAAVVYYGVKAMGLDKMDKKKK